MVVVVVGLHVVGQRPATVSPPAVVAGSVTLWDGSLVATHLSCCHCFHSRHTTLSLTPVTSPSHPAPHPPPPFVHLHTCAQLPETGYLAQVPLLQVCSRHVQISACWPPAWLQQLSAV